MDAGTILAGRFRIERLLGRGGMAAVYEATQLDLERRVALKLLSLECDALAAIEREARAAAQLAHPHIVQVTEICRPDDGPPFIVMELLEGESLDARINAQAPLAPDAAAFIAVQVLSALAAAHASKIVHRDVKPANVFLTRTAATDDFVKLLDFGVARRTSVVSSKRGAPAGTPAYMAPEQITGAELDGRVDLWAVGVCLYEMLSGTTPFDAQNIPALLSKICQDEHEPLDTRVGVEPALARIVDRALSKDRAARFATADEMRLALAPFARPQAIPARAIVQTSNRLGPKDDLAETLPFAPAKATEIDMSLDSREARRGGPRSAKSFAIGVAGASLVLAILIPFSRHAAPVVTARATPAPTPPLSYKCHIDHELEPWSLGEGTGLRMSAGRQKVVVSAARGKKGEARIASASLNALRLTEWNTTTFERGTDAVLTDTTVIEGEPTGVLIRKSPVRGVMHTAFALFADPDFAGITDRGGRVFRVPLEVVAARGIDRDGVSIVAGWGHGSVDFDARATKVAQTRVIVNNGNLIRGTALMSSVDPTYPTYTMDLVLVANQRWIGLLQLGYSQLELNVLDYASLRVLRTSRPPGTSGSVAILDSGVVFVWRKEGSASEIAYERFGQDGVQLGSGDLTGDTAELPVVTSTNKRIAFGYREVVGMKTRIYVGVGDSITEAGKHAAIVAEVGRPISDLVLAMGESSLWLGYVTVSDDGKAFAQVSMLDCPD